MKVAVVQLNARVGDVSYNLSLVKRFLAQSETEHVDIVVFPELTLTGYPPRDLLYCSDIINANEQALIEVRDLSKSALVLIGGVERTLQKTGRSYFNALFGFLGGKEVLKYRKHLLPYYDVFDESRYFEPGNKSESIVFQGAKIGVSICEDIWNEEGHQEFLYPQTLFDSEFSKDLDLFINVSASPFHLGKAKQRQQLAQAVAKKTGSPVLLCNQVGANDELIFDGASFVATGKGLVWTAPQFQEGLFVWDSTQKYSCLNEMAESEQLFRALVLGVRDYFVKSHLKKAVLGLSGGIDSSVVAVILEEALGKDNVTGVLMPSQFTSAASVEDAMALSKQLNLATLTIPIQGVFKAAREEIEESIGVKIQSLTQENLQPRIRMLFLMAVANEQNSILVNTSNKSEIATGYATLYGDSAGAVSVLGDLTKKQVYQLAEYINQSKKIIPERILKRAPSAELKENQTDQDTLPPYDILDRFVEEVVVEEKCQPQRNSPAEEKYWQDFRRLYQRSEFKRRQMPPILRVSRKAFGVGRRIPVVGVSTVG